MSKNTLLGTLKWLFAIGLLLLLIKSGKLSLSDIQVFLSHPLYALAALGCVGTVYMLSFFRWRLLLQSQGITVSFGTVFKLGMLGQFFSSIIPGTVGGDLVKAVYVARRYPNRKARTLSTILIDRLLGLFGLIVAGSIFFLVGRSTLASVQHKNVIFVESLGWLLVAVASVGLFILILFPKIGKLLPHTFPKKLEKLPGHSLFSNLYQAVLTYKNKISTLWAALGISVMVHVLNASALFMVALAIYGNPPWGSVGPALFILGSVLGTCAIAIPIAPQGLGVGQFAFSAIFVGLGAPTDQFGSSLITGFQIVSLALNLCGSLFFATYKHEAQEALHTAEANP